MKELLAQSGMYGKRLQVILDMYRDGTITYKQAIAEINSTNNAAWVGGEDIATVLFWALQNSVS